MKLAAMEALWDGKEPTGLIAVGLINPGKKPGDGQDPFSFSIEIPGMLTLLAKRHFQGFVPGINDLTFGNEQHDIVGIEEKISRGKLAVSSLADYKKSRNAGDDVVAVKALETFNQHQDYLGYGYLGSAEEAVPPVALTFYAFRAMVSLGTFFILLFLAFLYLSAKNELEKRPWLLKLGVISVFLGYLASQAGWVVTEVGRQPWAIQGLLPVTVARSNLDTGTVAVTFFMFLVLFTALLIAEIKIMTKQISIGPKGGKT
jgi:cytochrome d ubiquinol oxidase subunit I